MSRNGYDEDEFQRGYENGSKVQSAADEGAELIARLIQSQSYVEGFKEGERDRANGKA